ncbi:hypothetical protein T440DRAFT_516379 [Plenodomus tracheiphilus IPT5]|uniref:Rhodopsin domain-containing protein n=1 Tax=Plenodomus tracheiphilus IPT5 TaxID=1408161 RepID=A0A6A7BDJ0_9PLEO|nr:hypothetical protein T440DRAFT_516379 [Plenodomus tracheiphilus IPT5]
MSSSTPPPPPPRIPDPHSIPSIPSPAAQESARLFVGTALALHGIAILVFGARIWTRFVKGGRMYVDDWVCGGAYALILSNSSLLLAALPYTFNHNPKIYTLADAQLAFKYATIAQPLWACSMAALKTSFALTLLRIQSSPRLRKFLYLMIAVQILLGIYNICATLLQCVPVRKQWDLLGAVQGRCWSKRMVGVSSISSGVINILTDFTFALLPLSFLQHLRRPLRERVLLFILMALGVFAGVASVLKIVAASRFGATADPVNESIGIGMWSVIEELVGVIVICIPTLRSPVKRVLGYWGAAGSRIRQASLYRGYGRTYENDGEGRVGKAERSLSRSRLATVLGEEGDVESGFRLKILNTQPSSEEEGVGVWREEGMKRRGEIWCTKEVTVENEVLGHVPSNEHLRGGPRAGWVDESFDIADAARFGRAI